MTSKLALAALLAASVLMGGASAAMGASALSTATDASALQYGSPKAPSATLGQSGAPGGTRGSANEALNAGSGPEAVAAPRQVALAQNELPFTGYAPIPILLAGAILLALGLVLRRRNSHVARP